MMKVHKDLLNTKMYAPILKNAKKVGLDKIDYNKEYVLKKIGEKNPSPYGYEGEIIQGYPYLIGNSKDVALYFVGRKDWYKTSAIVKMNKDGTFETLNSYYKLI